MVWMERAPIWRALPSVFPCLRRYRYIMDPVGFAVFLLLFQQELAVTRCDAGRPDPPAHHMPGVGGVAVELRLDLELIEPPFDRPHRSDYHDERKIRRAMVS